MLRTLAHSACLLFLAALLLPASSLILNPDGRLEIFALGADGNAYHNSQVSSGGTWYSTATWPPLGGGSLTSPPEVVVDPNGIISLFATGSDGNIHSNYKLAGQDWYTTGVWGPLSGNGNLTGAPAAANGVDGMLQVFALSTDGNIYYDFQNSSVGAWYTSGGPWPSIGGGGLVSPPAVVVSSNGIISLFAMGSDGNVHPNYRIPGSDWQTTTTWGPLGGSGIFVGTPVAISNIDGSVEVFALAADGNVYHNYQTSSSGGWFTGGAWPSLGGGGLTSPPAAVVSPNGTVSLFAMGSDGNIHANYKTPGGGWATTGDWGALTSNGILAGLPLAITDVNGLVEVFAWGADGNFYNETQTSSGGWSTVASLGGGGALLGGSPGPKLLPSSPVKEYVYVDGQVIAIENAGP